MVETDFEVKSSLLGVKRTFWIDGWEGCSQCGVSGAIVKWSNWWEGGDG